MDLQEVFPSNNESTSSRRGSTTGSEILPQQAGQRLNSLLSKEENPDSPLNLLPQNLTEDNSDNSGDNAIPEDWRPSSPKPLKDHDWDFLEQASSHQEILDAAIAFLSIGPTHEQWIKSECKVAVKGGTANEKILRDLCVYSTLDRMNSSRVRKHLLGLKDLKETGPAMIVAGL